MKFKQIPLDKIILPEELVREVFSEEAGEELIHSMREFGLQSPIKVRPVGENYELVYGHRRLTAARALGWKKIPCVVEEMDDETAALVALEENIKREDVNPYEEAKYFLHLIKRHGLTQTEIANRLGVSNQYVHNRMTLLSLDPVTIEFVQRKELSMTHACELARIGDPKVRANIRAAVMAEEMSTLATRHLVDQVLALGPEAFEETEEEVPIATKPQEPVSHYRCFFCGAPGSEYVIKPRFVCAHDIGLLEGLSDLLGRLGLSLEDLIHAVAQQAREEAGSGEG